MYIYLLPFVFLGKLFHRSTPELSEPVLYLVCDHRLDYGDD